MTTLSDIFQQTLEWQLEAAHDLIKLHKERLFHIWSLYFAALIYSSNKSWQNELDVFKVYFKFAYLSNNMNIRTVIQSQLINWTFFFSSVLTKQSWTCLVLMLDCWLHDIMISVYCIWPNTWPSPVLAVCRHYQGYE